MSSPDVFSCTEGVILANVKACIARAKDAHQRKLLTAIMHDCDAAGDRLVTCSANAVLGGRMYAPRGIGLAFVKKQDRMIISVPSWDFDLVNAHPCLVEALCRRLVVPCPVLSDYISNRDVWLADTAGDRTEKDMKLACLRIMYGSKERPVTDRTAALQAEMATIVEKFAPHYSDLAADLKKHKPKQTDAKMGASLLSFILQREEVRLIRTTMNVLCRDHPAVKINSYIFDGFLVQRDNSLDPTALLQTMNSVLENDALARGRLRFVQKPFEPPEGFVPLKPGEGSPTNDVDALLYLLQKFPKYIKMYGTKKMVYDDGKGLWAEDDIAWGPFLRLVNRALPINSEYSHSKKHIRTMFDCMPILEDDSDFFVLGRQGIRGKLLFKDGIYDKMTEAQLPFTHELYFVHQVPWNIPREKPSTTDDVEKWFFKESFLQAGVPAYLKQMLMRAAFGLGYEELTFETGPGSNGKSARAQAVRNALGPYVADLDGAHVALEERAQPGAASPQTMVLEHARIVYIAEPPKTMVLNMPLFKRLTGGDPISGRNLYKGVVNFNSSAKVWFLVNNIPNFSECDESFMNKRIRQIDSDVRWLGPVEFQGFLTETKKNEAEVGAEGVFKADADRSRSCQAASDALLWLLISEPVAADLAALTPASVIAASRETVAERDEMKRAFDASFEWTRETGDKVASYELASVLKVQGKELCKKMRVWGYGTSKPVRVEGAVVQGYEGIRKRKARWLEDVN